MPARVPKVFISSTVEDLRPYRAAARDAAIAADFLMDMQEYFEAVDNPPLKECLERVSQCDLLVVIVAYRYGWRPDDGEKSITWLECERAKSVVAFLVDEKHDWPVEYREEYRLVEAAQKGNAVEAAAEVQANVKRLADFKRWLNKRAIRASFTNPDDLRGKVKDALRRWREDHPEFAKPVAPAGKADPAAYRKWLLEETAWIDIRGLQTGDENAHRFPITDLYIPLMNERTEPGEAAGKRGMMREPGRERLPLDEALKHRKLTIVGDPGSGKTTFLRHIAFGLHEAGGTEFPVLIRIAELAAYVAHHRPANPEAPSLLVDFLAGRSREMEWELDRDFFRQKMIDGTALVLLDGLDEAPGEETRKTISSLLEKAARTYGKCKFVVTSRPGAYTGEVVLPGFDHARIAELDPEAIERFLERWSEAIWTESPNQAKRHHRELLKEVSSPQIRRMARNPVMLTALAVLHWNEKKLPEQRAELYESIIKWLAKARPRKDKGRVPAEECVRLHAALALAMQSDEEGRRVQMPKREAAGVIAREAKLPVTEAVKFLDAEEVDSGIVVGRGHEVRFWHLTFQEFLAAKGLAGLPDHELPSVLLKNQRIYTADWRETALLLGGVLHQYGPRKVDTLLARLLDEIDDGATLAEKARCVGLLGAMLGDLRPYRYQITDERYGAALDDVLGVFETEAAAGIDFKVRLEAAEALGQAGDPRLRDDNWITIPAGTFLMGAQNTDRTKPNFDKDALDRETVREASLKAYKMGRYPVTVQEYSKFIEAGGYDNEGLWKAEGFGKTTEPDEWADQLLHPNRPVIRVSWYEAAAYCVWARGRLPTEAEWERAARGTDNRKYPWGNKKPDSALANWNNEVGYPTPVGLYPLGASAEGFCDLAGNVLEWVEDKWKGEVARVFRGGSWGYDSPEYLRSANRNRGAPEDRSYLLGFRCVRELVP